MKAAKAAKATKRASKVKKNQEKATKATKRTSKTKKKAKKAKQKSTRASVLLSILLFSHYPLLMSKISSDRAHEVISATIPYPPEISPHILTTYLFPPPPGGAL